MQGDGTEVPWSLANSFRTPAAGPTPPPAGALTLQVTSPADNATVRTATITVTGRTSPGAVVTVNETLATVQADGSFAATITFTEDGLNIIDVIASNSAGDTRTVTLTVTTSPRRRPMVFSRFAFALAVVFGLVVAGPLSSFNPTGVLASASEASWQIVDDFDGGSVIAKRKGEDNGRRAADDDDDDRRPRRGIVGIVKAKGTSDFTVDRLLGGTVKIKVDDRTRYRQVGSGHNKPDFDDLTVGMRVGVLAQRIVPAPTDDSAPAWLARGVELPRTKRERAHRIGIITALSSTSMSIVDRDGKEHTGIVDDDTRWLPTGATFAVGDRVLTHARWDDDEDAWRVRLVVKLGQPDATPSPSTTAVAGATPSAASPSATTTASPSVTASPSATATP